VVALGNALPPAPALAPAAVTHELAKHFFADDIAKLPPIVEDKSVDPKTYTAYVGRYDYQGELMTVTVEKDRIYSQITGQPTFEIFPKGPDEFFWKVAEASVRFLRNDKGDVIAARHTQGGNTFRAARLGSDEFKLTPEQLEAFVGLYAYSPFAILTVKRDDDQLFAQLTGQPAFPIFPTGNDSFEWRVVKANVRFVRGDDGKVIKAVHTQNGQTLDAPKLQPEKPAPGK
jgi:hypothetical protein